MTRQPRFSRIEKEGLNSFGFLLLFCLAFFAVGYRRYRGAILTPAGSWARTRGHITKSYVSTQTIRSGTLWAFNIEYEYRVNSIAYHSDQLDFAGEYIFALPESADGMVSRYPVGASETVFYQPNDPTFAVLRPDVIGMTIPWFVFHITVIVLLASGIVLIINKRQVVSGLFRFALWRSTHKAFNSRR